MTFGKVLEAFKSRFPGVDGGKELYLTDKKSGEWRYLSLINRVRGRYCGLLERLSLTFTANGKNKTFAVCLQLSVQ